jgi:hypothetical protein
MKIMKPIVIAIMKKENISNKYLLVKMKKINMKIMKT